MRASSAIRSLNTAGILAVFQVAARPSLLLPKIVVKDIRQLDLKKLRARGVTAVVVDKDNCLTKPKHDGVVEELQEAWPALVRTFGRRNVLVVSNSAGTRDDAGLLQAESVSRHLGVPVLLHATKKPGCAKAVYSYFSALNNEATASYTGKGKQREILPRGSVVDVAPSRMVDVLSDTMQDTISSEGVPRKRTKILVIGDRVMTDIVLANRINLLQTRTSLLSRLVSLIRRTPPNTAEGQYLEQAGVEAIGVSTTTVWKMEGPGSRVMRALEAGVMRLVMRYHARRRLLVQKREAYSDCIMEEEPVSPEAKVAQPISSPKSAVPAQTARERLHSGLAILVSPSIRFYTTLQSRIQKRLDAFLMEAKQTQFGFRLPEGYGRVRMLRRLLEGDQGRIAKKGL